MYDLLHEHDLIREDGKRDGGKEWKMKVDKDASNGEAAHLLHVTVKGREEHQLDDNGFNIMHGDGIHSRPELGDGFIGIRAVCSSGAILLGIRAEGKREFVKVSFRAPTSNELADLKRSGIRMPTDEVMNLLRKAAGTWVWPPDDDVEEEEPSPRPSDRPSPSPAPSPAPREPGGVTDDLSIHTEQVERYNPEGHYDGDPHKAIWIICSRIAAKVRKEPTEEFIHALVELAVLILQELGMMQTDENVVLVLGEVAERVGVRRDAIA
eukprot:gnl/TRDRNA2_/TRDRNA2_165834_c0_seq3.p1 gnl/TRDRNA2_/TRDRNA2_165834_c0~~gnl/TRDRNA2_/TRDRNA2_165834_c0_seq3.p1  ORF type:complete len:266 (+),score=37.14 gnl/TRDRNA2_/TRDRNA2_165834_c0_seq3:144-941(+)